MRTLSILLILATAPLAAETAQDVLEEAKAHYAAAAYEEALSTLTRLDSMPAMNRVELEQYRAFCLIALGKIPEAERAVAALVATDPKYVPSPTIASPRVLQLVSEMRRKELPGVAKRLFDDGRAAFKDKDFPKAQKNFSVLLQILDDPALKGRPESEDLRVLAEGFVALTDASVKPEPKPEPPKAAPTDAAVVRREPIASPVVVPPVPIRQTLPDWAPPDNIVGSRDYIGSIKVMIGTDGKVKAASIEKPTYPAYDARLLQAAKQWVYKPATRDGIPVDSEKVVAINLRHKN